MGKDIVSPSESASANAGEVILVPDTEQKHTTLIQGGICTNLLWAELLSDREGVIMGSMYMSVIVDLCKCGAVKVSIPDKACMEVCGIMSRIRD
jgi:hypothetical protein